MVARVYALAFAAEPGRGSEPGVGAEFARALAVLSLRDDCRVRLYTRSHRAEKLLRSIDVDVPGHSLEVVPVRIWATLARRLQYGWTRLAYVWWQLRATSAVMSDLRDVPARDAVIVHHVTFATVSLPSFERRIRRSDGSRPRFVFGPAGSSSMAFSDTAGRRGRILHFVRTQVARHNLSRVDVAVAQTTDLVPLFRELGAKEALASPNPVVDPAPELRNESRDPRRLINVGLLTPQKRQELALEAFSLLKDDDFTLAFVGSGPQEADLRRRTAELGLESRVTFLGKLSRADTLREIARSGVLLHTSRSEGAPWVIAEAQTVGTVPVAPAGTGSDSLIRLGGLGVVASDDSPTALAAAVLEAWKCEHRPTDMWVRDRLPGLLASWYQLPNADQHLPRS